MRTRSGGRRSSSASASLPLSATLTRYPNPSSIATATSRFTALSSTTRTWAPSAVSTGGGAAHRSRPGAGGGAGVTRPRSPPPLGPVRTARRASSKRVDRIGFTRQAANPAARKRSISPWRSNEVRSTRATSVRSGSSRTARPRASPSAPGISRSVITTPWRSVATAARNTARAASTEAASSTRIFQLARRSRRTRRLTSLSSTTSTRTPSSAEADTSVSGRGGATGSRRLTRKVEPWPTRLVTWSVPPMSATSSRLMASPSPVPPCRRVDDPSTWVNWSKIRSSCSAGIPIPVSVTTMPRCTSPSGSAAPSTSSRTWPRGVNLIAFPTRLTRTWRSRPGSPTARGRSGATRTISSRSFSLAAPERSSPTSSAAAVTSNGVASRCRRPASIFETSRMSLMMVRSASADVRTVAA